MKCPFILAIFVSLSCGAPPSRVARPYTAEDRILRFISADSLRGNLSFLASDALRGRWTPSAGLDVAAEFIASRFRMAGLAPGNPNAAANDAYFQVADLTELAKQSRELKDRKIESPIVGRNVAGILRGSNPQLQNTYIVVSAHYDHLGTLATATGLTRDKAPQEGDEIFNGANDDGSGTVSVIEIASALARLPQRPKRSILFLTVCGEELGLLGSEYYVAHPLVPLSQTVTEINIEQVGRSDGQFGDNRATLTGYDFTDLHLLFEKYAQKAGLSLVKTPENEPFFRQSDNLSFANAGIPDVTLASSYDFPDYHGLKDEWTKIDYGTMAKIDRMAALVIWDLANTAKLPEWNRANPKAARYLHPIGTQN